MKLQRVNKRPHCRNSTPYRSCFAVVDLEALGERSITIDCDVIQADGGTRTASITGAFAVLSLMRWTSPLVGQGKFPITDFCAAISVGSVQKVNWLLDLCYEEMGAAIVDMNVVRTGSWQYG